MPAEFVIGDAAWFMIDGSHSCVMSCQHGRPMGRFAGHNVVWRNGTTTGDRARSVSLTGDRGFESGSLQERVHCELGFTAGMCWALFRPLPALIAVKTGHGVMPAFRREKPPARVAAE